MRKAMSIEDSSLPESFKDAVRHGRPPQALKKVMLTMRYSTQVIGYFKSTGKGWQTCMDEVLLVYVDSHR